MTPPLSQFSAYIITRNTNDWKLFVHFYINFLDKTLYNYEQTFTNV